MQTVHDISASHAIDDTNQHRSPDIQLMEQEAILSSNEEKSSETFLAERNAILAAALNIFSRWDNQISRRQLARKAGVTTGILVKHFKSLLELRDELARMGFKHYTVSVYDRQSQIIIEKRSKNIWRASGFYALKHISTTGYSEDQAVKFWYLSAIRSDPIANRTTFLRQSLGVRLIECGEYHALPSPTGQGMLAHQGP